MSHAYVLDSYGSIDLGRTVRSRTRAAVANSTALVRAWVQGRPPATAPGRQRGLLRHEICFGIATPIDEQRRKAWTSLVVLR
jgi:hypothetical protein